MKTYSMKLPLDEEDSLHSLETSSLLDKEVDLTSDIFSESNTQMSLQVGSG